MDSLLQDRRVVPLIVLKRMPDIKSHFAEDAVDIFQKVETNETITHQHLIRIKDKTKLQMSRNQPM